MKLCQSNPAVWEQWLADVDPSAHPAFVSLRFGEGPERFALVRALEPDEDRLVVELLPADKTPLDLLAGFPDGDGEVVMIGPDKPVPNGGRLY